MSTPRTAPAPHSTRLSASSVRRSAPWLAPRAARTASSPSRRTERARIRLATFEQAMTKTTAAAARSTSRIGPRRRRDLIAQRRHGQLHVGSRRVGLGVLADHRRVGRGQLGARVLDRCLRRQPAEELGHPVHALDVHRRAHVVRAGHHVGDDLGVGGVRHRRLEDADDRRRSRAEAHRPANHAGVAVEEAGPEAMRQDHGAGRTLDRRPRCSAAGPAPAAGPSPRSTTRRPRRRAAGAARRRRAS